MEIRKLFIKEYQDIAPFTIDTELNTEHSIRYEQRNLEIRAQVEQFIDLGELDKVEQILSMDEAQFYSQLEEYRIIHNIIAFERSKASQIHFYQSAMNHKELMEQFRSIRYYLKRVEYGKEDFSVELFCQKYSLYAAMIMAKTYCDNLGRITAWIKDVYGINIDLGEYSYKELERRKYSISEFVNRPIIFAYSLADVNLIANFLEDIQNVLLIVTREEGHINDSSLLERIKEIRCHDVTMVRGVLRDEIYAKGRTIIICGVRSRDYAALYHNTDIPVKWYVEDKELIHREYSRNIEVLETMFIHNDK